MFDLMVHCHYDKRSKGIISAIDENAKIVKGRISVVMRGRNLKFWERSEKKNILRKRNVHCDGRR